MDDDAAPSEAPTNGSWARPLGVLGVLIGLAVAGVYGYSALRNQILKTPEQRALAELLGGLTELRGMDGPAREEKLRGILRGLAKTRRETATEEERALMDEALTAFGSGDPKGQLTGLLDKLRAARGDAATPDEQRAFDVLKQLAGGEVPRPSEMVPVPDSGATGQPSYPASDARVGQWVLIQHTLSGSTAPTFTYKWIAAIDGQTVTVKVQDLSSTEGPSWRASGAVYETFAMVTPLVGPPSAALEAIKVGEETFACFRLERPGRDGAKVVTWTTYEVPVLFGLYTSLRQVIQGPAGTETERHELTRYGSSGGGEHVRRR